MQDIRIKTKNIFWSPILRFFVFALCVLILTPQAALGGSAANFQIEILALCGNSIQETGESCDNLDLNGASCISRGYTGGSLACSVSCTFNTSSCTSGGGDDGDGGGGGGSSGGGGYIPPATGVIFMGRAYPYSKVVLLKDAQISATSIAGADAKFKISLLGLTGGNYTFSIYSEDAKGIRSPLLTFPVGLTLGASTQISGIFLAPTIAVDKSEVKRGDNIAIFGQSSPFSTITISINSPVEIFGQTATDNDGVYLYNFDTSQVELGSHSTKSKAALDGQISSFGKSVAFKVGTKNVSADLPVEDVLKGDLNIDGRVNLVDFSIGAYWYKRTISADFRVREIERLNGDGKVDLIDFSIMAFYWTG